MSHVDEKLDDKKVASQLSFNFCHIGDYVWSLGKYKGTRQANLLWIIGRVLYLNQARKIQLFCEVKTPL